jgi:hypothetical protein
LSASTGIGQHRGGSDNMGVCTMEDERNWFVGVDWASETHHVRVSDARGRKVGERAFAHSGEGLAAMAAWILAVTGAAPEAVFGAIEVPHGPVVESLMERGFRVHSINPKPLAQAARPSRSIASATASRRPVPRMIAETRRCSATRSALTLTAFARCSRSILWWSNFGKGHAWRRI